MPHDLDTRLRLHLRNWLGRWPATELVDVVGSVQRQRPAWDGRIFPLLGVGSAERAVLSVPPSWTPILRDRVGKAMAGRDRWTDVLPLLPKLLNRPDATVYSGVYRYCETPSDLPDAGVWVPHDQPAVPEWLRPFGHEVLIAFDPTGRYLSGVGLKRHDRYGWEIAVGTEPAAQGRGLARRLVAQAARRILAEGAIATYQHDPANHASAAVAEAAGFPDRGWRSLGMA